MRSISEKKIFQDRDLKVRQILEDLKLKLEELKGDEFVLKSEDDEYVLRSEFIAFKKRVFEIFGVIQGFAELTRDYTERNESWIKELQEDVRE